MPRQRIGVLRKGGNFGIAIRVAGVPEHQADNRLHSDATTETTGCWLAFHRAADLQQRCRLR
jgi:hypothetical protein